MAISLHFASLQRAGHTTGSEIVAADGQVQDDAWSCRDRLRAMLSQAHLQVLSCRRLMVVVDCAGTIPCLAVAFSQHCPVHARAARVS